MKYLVVLIQIAPMHNKFSIELSWEINKRWRCSSWKSPITTYPLYQKRKSRESKNSLFITPGGSMEHVETPKLVWGEGILLLLYCFFFTTTNMIYSWTGLLLWICTTSQVPNYSTPRLSGSKAKTVLHMALSKALG